MKFEEYCSTIERINTELQAIADRPARQAWVGIANSNNPIFVSMMQQQARLIALSSQLTERMIALHTIKNVDAVSKVT